MSWMQNLSYKLWKVSPDFVFALITTAYRILNPRRRKLIAIPLRKYTLFKVGRLKMLSPVLRGTSIVECLDYRICERYFELEKGDVVIDVGAGIGEFTIYAASKVGDKGLVLAIEPEIRNLKYLELNVKLNKLNNVIIVPKAIADYVGYANLYFSEKDTTSHSLFQRRGFKAIKVEVDTLDNIIHRYNIERIDFLKIDVEGAEYMVIKGARECLSRTRKVVIECHNLNNLITIAQLLRKYGFKVVACQLVLYAKR